MTGETAEAGGVLLMGGDCGALGAARSLGRLGIDIRFLPGVNSVAGFSRYARRVKDWPGAEADGAIGWLERYATHGDAQGFVLMPAGDSEVRLVTGNHARLSELYHVAAPPWQTLRYAADKQLTYERAAGLGIGHPRTWRLADAEAARNTELIFPLILKPAMKEGVNALTKAKAWRINDREQFLPLFEKALQLAGAGGLVVQELIPDTGLNQFSYTAFYDRGEPRAVMAARRTRQWPRKVGTGTFVETLGPQAFEADAEKFLQSLEYTGLVEIEFMLDPRDGQFKLIDVNPRIWTWHTLGLSAGVNFAIEVWSHANGRSTAKSRAAPGHSWIYMLRDIPAACGEIFAGNLRLPAYLQQLRKVSSFANFAWDDPLPALADPPAIVLRRFRR